MFVENLPLTAERASVLLAFNELAKVHPCDRKQDCSLVTQGEEWGGAGVENDANVNQAGVDERVLPLRRFLLYYRGPSRIDIWVIYADFWTGE